MRNPLLVLLPLLAASLIALEPAQAQSRELSISVSGQAIAGNAGPHHHRPGPPPHAASHQRRSRHARVSQQARMADWYASTAVAQSRQAWRVGCADHHPRWSMSYHEHYQWALGASHGQLMREIERRDVRLAQCRPYRRW